MKLSTVPVIVCLKEQNEHTRVINGQKTMSVSNLNFNSSMLSYGLKLPTQSPYMALGMGSSSVSVDLQRAQLQEYSQRLQLGMRGYPSHIGLNGLPYHSHLANPYLHPYFYKDPRARFIHEEPKPNHSYIGLIAMAILSAKEKKLVLSDIYQWILDNYTYFRTRGPGWRNSIRHNLSLNDCFIKSGRSANGKGHYWAIHPANLEDFQKGDFRRRRAQRRVRKHMGLAVPDDEDSPSPSESPVNHWGDAEDTDNNGFTPIDRSPLLVATAQPQTLSVDEHAETGLDLSSQSTEQPRRLKRTFDMDSLLAPDFKKQRFNSSGDDGESENLSSSKSESETKSENDQEIVIDSNDENDNSGELKEKVDIESERTEDAQKSVDNTGSLYVDVGDAVTDARKDVRSLSAVPMFDRQLMKAGNLSGTSRASAFRNPSPYNWGGLSGYLSSYQLMALNAAGQHSLMVPSSSLSQSSAQRWQQTMTQFLMQSRLKEASDEQN